MMDPVFLFGSFTEDEAKALQSPNSGSPGGARCQSSNISAGQNSSDPIQTTPPVVKQNGHPAPPTDASGPNGRLAANGKAAEDAISALGLTLGQSPEKHPAGPGMVTSIGNAKPSIRSPPGVANSGKPAVSKTPMPARRASNGSPEALEKAVGLTPQAHVKHGASDPSGNGILGGIDGSDGAPVNGVAFESGEPTEWLVVNSIDVSSTKDGSESGESSQAEIIGKESCKGSEDQGTTGNGVAVTDENGIAGAAEGDAEAVPQKEIPKSWAALVAKPGDPKAGLKQLSGPAGRSNGSRTQPGSNRAESLAMARVTTLSGDLWQNSLIEAERQARRLQPRGLINTGNSCFLNSILQAMVSCSAFAHLLRVLKTRTVPETGFPTLRAFVDFSGEFEFSLAKSTPKGRRNGEGKMIPLTDVGKPFAPAMFDTVLQSFTPDQPPRGTGRNRQEDAQEFLSFVMDRMHEEIMLLEGKAPPQAPSLPTSSEDEDWEMVGPKNRSAVTRTHAFSESAITDIFGGQLRSVVKTKGNKASATVQPFLVLHLDIVPEVVHSVEDALRFFAAPESLEGYKPPSAKVGEVVSASKSVKIQALPRVLILHLMRFSYGSGGPKKLHKSVHFPLEITLGRELLGLTTTATSEVRKYELVATVSHHGKDPSVGHYTADSKQSSGQWLRFDDNVVSGVGVSKVLQEQAYLLFYKRTCL